MMFLPLTVALSSLLMSPISARPLLADATNMIAQNSSVDEPFCYIKTPDGKTVDLGKLCDGNFLSGQVLNQGCKTIKNVKVNYEVLDESGNLIDNGFIYAEPVTLAPGQSATFRGAVVAGAKVQATHADAQE
jgi:hypothetical protein